MTSQRQVNDNQDWLDALRADLVRRLTRPLTCPGVMRVRQLQSALIRAERMLHGFPIVEALSQRWGTAVADQDGQLPIVYVPPLTADQLRRALPNQPDVESLTGGQTDADRPATRPVVQPLSNSEVSTPNVPSLPLSGGRAEPETETRQAGPMVNRIVTAGAAPAHGARASAFQDNPGRRDTLMLPILPPATSEEIFPSNVGYARPPLAAAEPTTAPSNASAPIVSISAGRVGVIQRSPLRGATPKPSLPLRKEGDDTPSGLSPVRSTHLHGSGNAAPFSGERSAPRFAVVQAKFARGQQPLPVTRPRWQTQVRAQMPGSSPGRSSRPIVAAWPTPRDGLLRNGQGVASVAALVVRAQPTANSSQPLTPPDQTMPMARMASGVMQRSPLPAAGTSAVRPSSRVTGLRRGRAAGRSNVIQRQPDGVMQRTNRESRDTEQPEGVDIDAIVDRVHRQFMRRLAVEGERRGVTSWP